MVNGYYQSCISCTKEMTGIFSHDARDTCDECGGHAKCCYDDSGKLITDKQQLAPKIEVGVKQYREMELKVGNAGRLASGNSMNISEE